MNMINRKTYIILRRFVFIVWVALIAVPSGFAQENYSTVQLNGTDHNLNVKIVEEHCIDFYVIGMMNDQDAVIAEDVLADHIGINRARANFTSRRGQVITLMSSGVNEQTLADLLATVGFTIRNFSVRVINTPVTKSQGNEVHNTQCEENHGQVKRSVTHTVVTAEQRLKQIILMRKEAIKNGTPVYKYDKLIIELNQQIKSKNQQVK